MKVYIAFRYSSESQCPPDTTEIIGVFDSEEKARKCIEECTTDIRKFKSTKDKFSKMLKKIWKEKKDSIKNKYPELRFDGLGNPYLFDPGATVEVDVDETVPREI